MTDVPSPTANPTVILIEFQQPFYFFPEPLDSLFLPCCQWFSSLFLTALIPPRDSFSFLSSSACDSSYPDLWCLGLSLFLLNRNLSQTRFGFQAPPLFQPWEVLTLYWSILSLSSADDSIAGIKKGDRKMETWSPEDQKQAVTPGTQAGCEMLFRISGK